MPVSEQRLSPVASRWPAVATVARASFGWRLRSLPYMYTAFHDAHVSGCPVARPLFMAFPSDGAVRSNNKQWMLGDALMVTPVLDEGATSVTAYFPKGLWFSLYDYTAVDASARALSTSLTAPVTDPIPVHILAGSIVPIGASGSNVTSQARSADLTILAAFPHSGGSTGAQCGTCQTASGLNPGDASACGHMYLDDGEGLAEGTGCGHQLDFAAQLASAGGSARGVLTATWGQGSGDASGSCSNVTWPRLASIVVLGVGPVDMATVSVSVLPAGAAAAGSLHSFAATDTAASNGSAQELAAGTQVKFGAPTYDAGKRALTIPGLTYQLACPDGLQITWSSSPPSRAPGKIRSPATPQTAEAG